MSSPAPPAPRTSTPPPLADGPVPGRPRAFGRPPTTTDAAGILWLDVCSEAVRTARVAVVDRLADWRVDTDTLDDAALLTAELVGNVVAHTSNRSVGIAVSAAPDRIAVSVHEQRPRELARADELIPDDVSLTAPTNAIRGRGLKLLDALAAEWGVSRAHRTTSTWFTVAPLRRLPLAAIDPASAAAAAALGTALQRTEMLLDITVALNDATSPENVSEAVTDRLRSHTEALFVGIAMVDGDGASMHYVSLSPLPSATAREWTSFAHDGLSPVSAAARAGTDFVHRDIGAAETQFPGIAAHMRTAGVESMVHLPMVVGGTPIGTLSVCWDAPLAPADADLDLLRVVAGFAAQSLRSYSPRGDS